MASNLRAADGSTGRVTVQARIATLKNFFAIIRQRASLGEAQTDEEIDRCMANVQHGFSAAADREQYGIAGAARGGKKSSYGRVTIYCNPHDVVVSSVAIEGIGWRGLSGSLAKDSKDGGELAATEAAGVCVQRVFAQGFEVGKQGSYHYWSDHWRKPAPDGKDFWFPAQKFAIVFHQTGRRGQPGESLFHHPDGRVCALVYRGNGPGPQSLQCFAPQRLENRTERARLAAALQAAVLALWPDKR